MLILPERALINGHDNRSSSITVFLNILAIGFCHIGPLCLWGQTLGKLFFGLRVVTVKGSAKISPWQVLLREIVGKFISAAILGLGFLFALWRSDRRTLYDLLSDAKVVKYRHS